MCIGRAEGECGRLSATGSGPHRRRRIGRPPHRTAIFQNDLQSHCKAESPNFTTLCSPIQLSLTACAKSTQRAAQKGPLRRFAPLSEGNERKNTSQNSSTASATLLALLSGSSL